MNLFISTRNSFISNKLKALFGVFGIIIMFLFFNITRGYTQNNPVITLKGVSGLNDTIKLEQGGTFFDPGYSAYSPIYGDITSSVIVNSKIVGGTSSFNNLILGTYVFIYNDTDIAGNQAPTQYRIVKIVRDTSSPVLIVAGPDTTYVQATDAPLHPSPIPKIISVYDIPIGSPVSYLEDTFLVNTYAVGIYQVIYSATDPSGNKTIVYRYIDVIDTIKPILTLEGKNPDTIEVFKSFIDPGVYITDNYFAPVKLMSRLKIADSININTLGKYTVTYNLTDSFGNKARPVVREVVVVDTIPPSIRLAGPSHDSVLVLNTYHDYGYFVSDNYSTNIKVDTSGTFYKTFKNGFANKPGNYTIIFTATDGSGNKASVTRYVKVYDNVPFIMTLIGPSSVDICRYSVYKDSGYKVDTPAFSRITVDTSGSFLSNGTSSPGHYQITYSAKDTFGNHASVTRMINVLQSGANGCTSSIANVSNSLNDIKLFPNPASQNINIDPGDQTITEIRMINELGMLVFELHNPETGILQIPVSQYKPGIYMIIISSENGIVVRRVLKN